MPDINKNFLAGKMNKDSDIRLLPKGEYRDALNIRLGKSEGGDVGAIENSLGNESLTSLTLGTNIKTIGAYSDVFEEKIYWFVKSSLGCYLIEYDINTDTDDFVLEDTRTGVNNVLNFDEDYLITGVNLVIDSDNDARLLYFTDGLNPPRQVNIERAKSYGLNGFDDEMISVIKKPPLYAPTISLGNTPDVENNLEEKFLRFAYRYKYLDGEYSALSPYSDLAFDAKTFNYDYQTGTNESMLNSFNTVDIGLNTGSALVTDIEIVFKESGHNNIYLIETLNKADKGWADDYTLVAASEPAITFTNNKIYRVLPEKELFRLYDNVPLNAKAQEVIGNRLSYGNYTENYDVTEVIDLETSLVETAISSLVATPSFKSNRDYELGIVYLDEYGRMTTPLTSEGNTIHIPNANSVKQNEIQVTINHTPPSWAQYYRLFIKQNKTDYDTLLPSLFYEDDSYRWIKLEKSDIDKIKEGDYLVVKSDSSSVLSSFVKTKVLEIKEQDKNFLQPEDVTSEIIEKQGVYFKIKPKSFNANVADYYNFEFLTYHNSSSKYHDVFHNPTSVIYPASFYGDTLDDMTSGGTCTLGSMADARYIVQIDATGTPDAFQWSDDNGDSWTTGVLIDGTAQSLSNGITVTFAATTGHSLLDEWNFYASGELNSLNSRAYGWYRTVGDVGATLTSSGLSLEDEVIENGANIDMEYSEYGAALKRWSISTTSSGRYDNIMEWYYRENIYQEILDELEDITGVAGFDENSVKFMRCVVYDSTAGNAKYSAYNTDGFMTMIVESQNPQDSAQVKIATKTNIFQPDGSRLVFETDRKDEALDVFYEIGQTYPVTGGYHIGNGGSDTDQSSGIAAEIILPFYNCYAWGNAVESYKIRDEFNADSFKIDTRPSTPIDDYRQNNRIASITYSDVYEQSLNYNALNEFNLATANYTDLDDSYGSIQKLHSRDTNMLVFQENKTHNLPYKKNVLYSAEGQSNLVQSNTVFGTPMAFAGIHGISTHPESFSQDSNRIYHTDERRGTVLRLSTDGYTEISDYGMRDYFRDEYTVNKGAVKLGGYDPYHDQYLLSSSGKTVSYDERVNGFTSFHSYVPDWIIGLNNRLYTIKDGQLWLHNSELVDRNNFYGAPYTSTIKTAFNDAPSNDKIFKTLVLESDDSWDATLTTNLANSTLDKAEFNNRESRWYTYLRKNESVTDLNTVAQGIGEITAASGLTVTFNAIPSGINYGDTLYQLNGSTQEVIGQITDITGGVVTVDAIVTTPVIPSFAYSKKDPRIEGSEMRGYYMEVELTNDNTEAVELFAINTNAVKSYL